MKRICILSMICMLLLCAPNACAQEEHYKEYGKTIIVNTEKALPDIPVMNTKNVVRHPMVSEETIKSKYNIKKVNETEDAEIERIYRSYESEELDITVTNVGDYTYRNKNKKPVESILIYNCIDSHNDFVPDEGWMVNKSEFDFMSAADACAVVEDEIKALMPDTYASFDIELIAHPAHAEDMQKLVTKTLKEECKTQEDLDFYRRKFWTYEGCIADDDNYYFIEGRWKFDGVQMLKGTMSFPHELYVDGPTLWAIVGKDGITYLDIECALYVTKEEPREPIERTSDEVLTKVGEFMDNLIGMEPYNIDKVELVYVPYPTAMHEYEMTPVLELSGYDAEYDSYDIYFRVNVLTYELVF